MNGQFVKKCEEVFVSQSKKFNFGEEIAKFQQYFDFTIIEEYRYILENFTESFLKDDYEFKAMEKTPLTDYDGYDRFLFFFSLQGENSIYREFKKYKQQLPIGFIPVGDVEGGNLLCIQKTSGDIYIWIHDENGNNIHLVNHNIFDFICSIEKHIREKDEKDIGLIEANYTEDFLRLLNDYKDD